MASNTRKTWKQRSRKHSNEGKTRKAKDSKKSTAPSIELFADLGEPGKPAVSRPR